MAAVFDVLRDERNRLRELSERYSQEISDLPKGSLSRKRRGNSEYCYLAYREAGRVKFDYIGRADSEKIQRRRALEEKLRLVNQNLEEVERSLRGQRGRSVSDTPLNRRFHGWLRS